MNVLVADYKILEALDVDGITQSIEIEQSGLRESLGTGEAEEKPRP